MIYWTVEPSLLPGAELHYPSTLPADIKSLTTVWIISSSPGKIYSIGLQVQKCLVDKSIKNPLIKINKDNIGPLTKGDKVFLLSFNPPIAKEVLLVINSKYHLPEGNWGNKIVNPAINNHIIDLGQKTDFVYGNENPIVVSGYVKATVPKAPALVDERTIFIIEKFPQESLTKLKIDSDVYIEKRTNELIENNLDEKFKALSSIRNNNYSKVEKTFNYSQIDSETLYKIFVKLLENSFHTFINNTVEIINDNYLASVFAYPQTNKGQSIPYFIELMITGKNNFTTLIIIGYAAQIYLVEQILVSLEAQAKKASSSLKEVPQVISDLCGGCNARLDLTKQNEKGIVFCNACKSPNILPYALRL